MPALVMSSIYLRDNATLQLQSLQLGQPKYLSYEEARQAGRVALSELSLSRAWAYWVRRAKKAMPEIENLKG
jgi:hypothetical protein